MIQAVLRNAAHPEYGEATIPFPIPEEEYGHCLELLEALEIGNAVNRDCKVQEVQDGPPILKRLEGSRVNLDELDYLAKRLDSFTDQELAQFQSAAVSYDYSNMKQPSPCGCRPLGRSSMTPCKRPGSRMADPAAMNFSMLGMTGSNAA